MNTTKNTILITGGSAGIGFEMAKQFIAKDNQVIIIGRNAERLNKAAAQLPGVTAIQCDVTNEDDVNKLVKRLNADFPNLNMLINNAGSAYVYKLSADSNAFAKAQDEMMTNYFSIIRLTEALLPTLEKNEGAAIVNVSSIVAFAPSIVLPTYTASKAALHSYTKTLRLTLSKETNIKVFELMPPLVDTDFSVEIGGATNGIKPEVVATDLVNAIEADNYEIHVGNTASIYQLSLKSPQEALMAMNN
jgi:uncharacterized oxidoreductase